MTSTPCAKATWSGGTPASASFAFVEVSISRTVSCVRLSTYVQCSRCTQLMLSGVLQHAPGRQIVRRQLRPLQAVRAPAIQSAPLCRNQMDRSARHQHTSGLKSTVCHHSIISRGVAYMAPAPLAPAGQEDRGAQARGWVAALLSARHDRA